MSNTATPDKSEHKLGEHAPGCEGDEWVELHRIDPEDSRPVLGTTSTEEDGSVVFKSKRDRAGAPIHGAKKYKEKVIIYYCPICGAKKEEAWTEE